MCGTKLLLPSDCKRLLVTKEREEKKIIITYRFDRRKLAIDLDCLADSTTDLYQWTRR